MWVARRFGGAFAEGPRRGRVTPRECAGHSLPARPQHPRRQRERPHREHKCSVQILVAAAHGPIRFRELERDGLVTRTVHPTVPPRVEYELTSMARELHATLLSLTQWAERHRVTIAEARAAYDAEHAPELLDV
ncbi:winged helix-turn-helix transcriptional regulator [Streptomyces sp. Y2F8-2]|uniref:winged helix-turn-helix transcriptional regulator n=1 Tax=Streptomyces sp. Y2F8-2 TaxID=2759675 RepID=UPI001904F5A8